MEQYFYTNDIKPRQPRSPLGCWLLILVSLAVIGAVITLILSMR